MLTPAAEYLPEGEEPKVFASMNAPPGYNLATMMSIATEIDAYLEEFIGADPASFRAGEAPLPALAYVNMRVTPQSMRIIAEPVAARATS